MKTVPDVQNSSDIGDAKQLVKHVQESSNPIVLTVDGKPAAVVQSIESYRNMAERAEFNDSVRIIKQRLEDIRNGGELIPADEVFRRLSEKYGITFDKEARS